MMLANGCLFSLDPAPTSPTHASADLTVAELDPVPHPAGDALNWHAVKNEWLDAFLLVTPAAEQRTLKLANSTLPKGVQVRAYRVESVPTNTASVSSVRDLGPGVPNAQIPSALVPLEPAEGEGFLLPPDATLLYFELAAPIEATPGTYSAVLSVGGSGGGLPLSLALDDVALSDAPEFALYGQADMAELAKLFPRELGNVSPQTLARGEPADMMAVERLDSLVRLARDNRVNLGFSGLQPVVKNTPREGLRIDWSSYDSLVVPWLTGEFDLSRPGLSTFPLPVPDLVAKGSVAPKPFVAAALSHFDQNRLLSQAFVPTFYPPESLPRNAAAARVRRADNPPLPSPLSDRGVRYLAWRAFAATQVNAAPTVVIGDVAPAADARRQVWFYPGSMFGVPGVVPGLGLKRARRAVQDYQIFDLAQQRGAGSLAVSVARKATRVGAPTVSFGDDLLTPAVSRQTWEGGLAIVRAAMVARPPGSQPEPSLATEEADAFARWSAPLDAAPVLPARTEYTADGEVRATLDLGAAGAAAELLRAPDGWQDTRVQIDGTRLSLHGHLDPTQLRYPIDKALDDRNNPLPPNGTLSLRTRSADVVPGSGTFLLPAAWVVPSAGHVELDGKLNEWSASEVVHVGGLTRMLDRYAAQSGRPVAAAKPTEVLARWDDGALYLAFRSESVGPPPAVATNQIAAESGRAFGRDVLRITLAPPGQPPVRILAKPQALTVESPGGSDITAASTVENGTWRCEVRIPAALLGGLRPNAVLPFNVVRHDATTGESSSWAGPLDRDDQPWMGLLVISDVTPSRAAR